MTGCSPEDVRFKFHNRLSKMILPKDWIQMEQQIESAAAGNGVLKTEYRERGDALPVKWYSIQATVFQANGLTELQGIIMDISKLKDYEHRLQRERDYYDTLYQNMLCGIAQYAYDDPDIGFKMSIMNLSGY